MALHKVDLRIQVSNDPTFTSICPRFVVINEQPDSWRASKAALLSWICIAVQSKQRELFTQLRRL